ncbi:DNA cytosine methyltransferase [Azohydromonas lata]|uniref:Cytosine-specific methyltransferase n=1 Tax=Azohydromonas lata TaxID=45677 RepID=A0ABU5IHP3_9BURK|nr:DNA cytosine methyltransferase [Azohydromonas lata]MDZ5458016.1 DNA cytosine methyltransferase [Azohydromonas lata]
MNQYNYIDLFAGAGGLSLGFERIGFRGTLAVEQDKWAAETYSANHPSIPVHMRDIQTIDNSEIANLVKYPVDVIVGGPPCQGFSHANTTKRDPKDPRNSLFQDFVRFAKVVRPSICLVENVPGLLRTKMSSGRPAISAIEQAFRDIGYLAHWKILNAADFGVPQRRERLFVVAIRDDLSDVEFEWPTATHSTTEQDDLFAAANGQRQITLWEAIADLHQLCAGDPVPKSPYRSRPTNAYQSEMREKEVLVLENHEPMRHTQRIVERFAAIGHGQSEADVPAHLRPRKRGSSGEISGIVYDQNSRRQNPDEPCNAIVASSHTNFIHPYLHRNFTVREMMRIQSFPDWFVVKGKRAVLSKKLSAKKGYIDDVFLDQRAQIGNAVPPKLGAAVGKAVWNTLERMQNKVRHAA